MKIVLYSTPCTLSTFHICKRLMDFNNIRLYFYVRQRYGYDDEYMGFKLDAQLKTKNVRVKWEILIKTVRLFPFTIQNNTKMVKMCTQSRDWNNNRTIVISFGNPQNIAKQYVKLKLSACFEIIPQSVRKLQYEIVHKLPCTFFLLDDFATLCPDLCGARLVRYEMESFLRQF